MGKTSIVYRAVFKKRIHMRVFVLSDLSDVHTKKWISSLANNRIEIFLFGLNKPDLNFYQELEHVTVYSVDLVSKLHNPMRNGAWEKLGYLKVIHTLKQKIKEFQPDILHAHYATSHGLLGALTGFHPFIISVWGSDVYDFPKVSFFHKAVLKFNLNKADKILSTSHIMAKQTQIYTSKKIEITPFGVDIKLFQKKDIKKESGPFVIGTIKALSYKYGIDTLIDAFNIVKNNYPYKEFVLNIIGKGDEKEMLQKKVNEMGIEHFVNFIGEIENSKVPEYLNQMDVFVALSRLDSESFGVAVVEAMACECPVVASAVDGFKEVMVDGETGYIVPYNDPQAAAEKIQKLVDDNGLREYFGRMGRQRVCKLYDWSNNVDTMINIYQNILNKKL